MHQPPPAPGDRLLGFGLLMLAAGLVGNTLLGPLFLGLVTYPFTETVVNETLGLEAVSLALVAPFAAIAAVLTLRGHPAGPVLALSPTSYAAYMLVQYVVGPQYATYQPSIAAHLALFVLSAGLVIRAWASVDRIALASISRRWAIAVFLMTAFVVSRWLPAFVGMASGSPVPVAGPDLTMYWSIFLLDMGLVVPIGIATGAALLRDARWATVALYGLVGWFALVPPSVAAMSLVKVLRDDPLGTTADAALFVVVTVVFWVVAAALYRRLFASSASAQALDPVRPYAQASV